MDNILNELKRIEREMASATAEKNQAEGAKKNILSALEQNFNTTTLAEADEKLNEIGMDLEEGGESIEAKFKDLQENYSW